MTTNQTALEHQSILNGNSEQILQLLQASYSRGQVEPSIAAETKQTLQAVQSIPPDNPATLADQLTQQLPADRALNPSDYSIIAFVQDFFDIYCTKGPLHEDIKETLAYLRKAAVFYMLSQHQWPWACTPNLTTTVQVINQRCLGWSPQFKRASSRFLNTLKSLLIDLSETRDLESFNQANRNLNDFFNSETKRIDKLEKRLQEAEKGALHARHAQRECARFLNQLMAGKKLPKHVSEFLHGPIQQSIQLLLMSKADETQHQQLVDVVETLIQSFQPIDSEEQRKHIYESISILTKKLPEIVISLRHAPHQLESHLSIIEQEHLKVLRNEPLKYEPFELINNTDPLSCTYTVISSHLLKQVSALSEGQWFCFQDKDAPPIKLTLKLNDAKQLLFTNFFGVKAKVYSFEEFAYELSSKAIALIDQEDHYKSTGEKLIYALYDNYQDKKQQQAAIYAEKQQRLKAQLRAREIAREAREIARAKALEEAKQLAEAQQRARIEAENLAKEAEIKRRKAVIEQSRQGKITTDINRLHIGGQVEFYNDSGECRRFKLAVKLQSSGKYVFIDSTGVKREEKLEKDLTKMLAEGSAQIISEGVYFEDSLEKVVNGLRKQRKE